VQLLQLKLFLETNDFITILGSLQEIETLGGLFHSARGILNALL
jgi:hypothetical protein